MDVSDVTFTLLENDTVSHNSQLAKLQSREFVIVTESVTSTTS
jgi:hypothetical protein